MSIEAEEVEALVSAMWECPSLWIGSYGDEDYHAARDDAGSILRELDKNGFKLVKVDG